MVRKPCPRCEAAGEVELVHCPICSKTWQDVDYTQDTLPCGHPLKAAQQSVLCPMCHGACYSIQWMDAETFERSLRGEP